MVEADEKLDVRRMACPMPVLLTRRKLAQMECGKVLEVVGDYPTAKENIQRLVREQGHEVLDVVDERSWFGIFIKKKESAVGEM